MKIGQTSAVLFVSKVVTSLSGFAATLYFANVLGAEVLGTYFLLLSAVAWITILVDAGVRQSIIKRMSEQRDPGAYFQVGLLVVAVGVVGIVLALLVLSRPVTDYVGHPMATISLVVLVGAGSAVGIVKAGLAGSHKVHVTGLMDISQTLLRVVLQVFAVLLGSGLVGLVYGWALAATAVAALGGVLLTSELRGFPTRRIADARRKLQELYSFAKYSWLGSVKSKTNNYADVLILGLFVPNDLIGIYSVCWNIASFLTIFGASISQTLFPEFSQLDQQGDDDEIADLVGKSMQYTGMLVIPGLFGGALLAERILRLYGSEFTAGATVLFLLIIAVLVFDYQKQLTNALAGMDRPDLDFRVNGIFIGSNVLLNVVLIRLLGWEGAAVATVLSSSLSMVYAYHTVIRLIDVAVPYREIGYQLLSSVLMSGVVFGMLSVENDASMIDNNVVVVLATVGLGAATYAAVLLVLSGSTRRAVFRNIGVRDRSKH